MLCAPCQDVHKEQQTAGLAPRARQQQCQETCRAEPITDTRGIHSPDLTCLYGSLEKVVENFGLILQTLETCCMKALLAGFKLLPSKLASSLPFEYKAKKNSRVIFVTF